MNNVHLSNINTKIDKEKNEAKKAILNSVLNEYKNTFSSLEVMLNSKEIDFIKVTEAINNYRKFVANENNKLNYTAQSKFESTILEEFVSLLLKFSLFKVGNSEKINVGQGKLYSKMSFMPSTLNDFINNDNFIVDEKDQDSSIYKSVKISANHHEQEIKLPIVSLECKTYLDKTMLEGSVSTAEKIKQGNPYCFFAIACETYDVKFGVNLKGTALNQVFVLCKRKRNRKEIVADYKCDVVESIFNDIITHLKSSWFNPEESLKKFGKMI